MISSLVDLEMMVQLPEGPGKQRGWILRYVRGGAWQYGCSWTRQIYDGIRGLDRKWKRLLYQDRYYRSSVAYVLVRSRNLELGDWRACVRRKRVRGRAEMTHSRGIPTNMLQTNRSQRPPPNQAESGGESKG